MKCKERTKRRPSLIHWELIPYDLSALAREFDKYEAARLQEMRRLQRAHASKRKARRSDEEQS